MAVSVVATLLKQVPAAAKFRPKLEALELEVTQLRDENARLKQALAQYIEQWETLDGPQVSTLQYLAASERGHAAAIAGALGINIQIAESSLLFLEKLAYVSAASTGGKGARGNPAQYLLSPKGQRYLQSRGL
jgi:hypothetical protein